MSLALRDIVTFANLRAPGFLRFSSGVREFPADLRTRSTGARSEIVIT
jgi:hypothetical protein